jgi:cytochrome c-type biogenesis protein CcmH
MLPYLLTALAGVVVGIVAARVWLMPAAGNAADAEPRSKKPAIAGGAVKSTSPKRSWSLSTIALVGAGAVALLSIAIVVFRGDNQGSGSVAPLAPASKNTATATSGLDNVDVMIERLAKRLETQQDDGEGFRMLGWSYVSTGKADKAIPAYKRALQLLPQRADVHAGYGEALVDVAGGTVTPQAKASFDRAMKLDSREPRARFFQALYRAQHGDKKGALDQWIDLANSGPADAPWQADLQKRISATAGELGQDVSGRLKTASGSANSPASPGPQMDPSAVAAVKALPPVDQQAMIDKMVEGLAQKLAKSPNDPEGWVKLLRSRMVLKQTEQASRDLTIARRELAKSPADLAQINAAAHDLGVPGS